MHWLNLELKTLHSPEYIGSDPIQRATWLALLGYCAEQENGGVIRDCVTWKDRQWQQTCGVTQAEVSSVSALWTPESGSIRVLFYPTAKEIEIKAKREGGRKGGATSSPAKVEAARTNGAQLNPSLTQADPKLTPNGREGKGIEGKEKKEKGSPRFSPPTVEEVRAYIQEKGYGFKAETFVAHYQSNGWNVGGKSAMKDWRACCTTWEERRKSDATPGRAPQKSPSNAAHGADPHRFDHLIERSPNNG